MTQNKAEIATLRTNKLPWQIALCEHTLPWGKWAGNQWNGKEKRKGKAELHRKRRKEVYFELTSGWENKTRDFMWVIKLEGKGKRRWKEGEEKEWWGFVRVARRQEKDSTNRYDHHTLPCNLFYSIHSRDRLLPLFSHLVTIQFPPIKLYKRSLFVLAFLSISSPISFNSFNATAKSLKRIKSNAHTQIIFFLIKTINISIKMYFRK